MTKAELIAKVSAQAGASSADTERVLDAFRDVIQATITEGDEVAYPGLGKFTRVERKERTARNPQTGESIRVPASNAPKFTAATALKNIVKGQAEAPSLSA